MKNNILLLVVLASILSSLLSHNEFYQLQGNSLVLVRASREQIEYWEVPVVYWDDYWVGQAIPVMFANPYNIVDLPADQVTGAWQAALDTWNEVPFNS